MDNNTQTRVVVKYIALVVGVAVTFIEQYYTLGALGPSLGAAS